MASYRIPKCSVVIESAYLQEPTGRPGFETWAGKILCRKSHCKSTPVLPPTVKLFGALIARALPTSSLNKASGQAQSTQGTTCSLLTRVLRGACASRLLPWTGTSGKMATPRMQQNLDVLEESLHVNLLKVRLRLLSFSCSVVSNSV